MSLVDYDALNFPEEEKEDFPVVFPFEQKGNPTFAGGGSSFPHIVPPFDDEEYDEEEGNDSPSPAA